MKNLSVRKTVRYGSADIYVTAEFQLDDRPLINGWVSVDLTDVSLLCRHTNACIDLLPLTRGTDFGYSLKEEMERYLDSTLEEHIDPSSEE